MTKGMQQLLQSSKRLIRLKADTQQAVTAVRVQGDEQESIRRQKDERMRQVGACPPSSSLCITSSASLYLSLWHITAALTIISRLPCMLGVSMQSCITCAGLWTESVNSTGYADITIVPG